MLYSVLERGMTPFHFQTTQKSSAFSVQQLENSMMSYRALQLNNDAFLCFNCLINMVFAVHLS